MYALILILLVFKVADRLFLLPLKIILTQGKHPCQEAFTQH